MIEIDIEPKFNNILKFIFNKKNSKKNSILTSLVSSIIKNVKIYGDLALNHYTKKYDNVDINIFKVSDEEINKSNKKISKELKNSITKSYENIKYFHENQINKIQKKITPVDGVNCWTKNIPIEKIGLYIPGGTAPLISTILMLGVPAKLAGCKNIILCTPPNQKGSVHQSILYTAKYLGIYHIYKLGGAQAIAAMAYGTKSIPSVYKIFGPGNSYVNKAKKIISQKTSVSIDVPAGPSEVVIIADNTANPNYVASDVLSQLEHDTESYAIIITTNKQSWIHEMNKSLKKQINYLENRKNIINKSIKNSKIITFSSIKECIKLSNEIAPEHLIINCNNYYEWSKKIFNAGSVFLGNYSPVSAGDYATGTNHVLPTNGSPKSYSGISIDSFIKKMTFQEISKKGLKNLSKCINTLSSEEGLLAHKKSIDIRLK
ncbi:histidinol dehydrogenase [Blattabacterium cuenoti]|uniref:histidinol dehydrogenase n=1 Tax=Blattabacterium cuenoti TaxID=1653831 RepID=UPI00163C2FA3|nr:histidinol dehydrogenase [Blattabacterium cuenoti]